MVRRRLVLPLFASMVCPVGTRLWLRLLVCLVVSLLSWSWMVLLTRRYGSSLMYLVLVELVVGWIANDCCYHRVLLLP